MFPNDLRIEIEYLNTYLVKSKPKILELPDNVLQTAFIEPFIILWRLTDHNYLDGQKHGEQTNLRPLK